MRDRLIPDIRRFTQSIERGRERKAVVEPDGIEPTTSAVRLLRSPN
jgi:hypothetical protein